MREEQEAGPHSQPAQALSSQSVPETSLTREEWRSLTSTIFNHSAGLRAEQPRACSLPGNLPTTLVAGDCPTGS